MYKDFFTKKKKIYFSISDKIFYNKILVNLTQKKKFDLSYKGIISPGSEVHLKRRF